MNRNTLLILVSFCAANPLWAADIKYISDDFEITMRNGASTTNSILRMLRSGEKVTLLEEEIAPDYSLIETDDGKQGYVLSRFLVDIPAAKQSLLELETSFAQQQSELDAQVLEIAALKQMLNQEKTDNDTLKTTLRASEQELSEVLTATQDTLDILEQNKRLQALANQLQQEQAELSESNTELSDSTQLDWFVRGGAVSLIAFVIGILVTRIRWKRHDSWGSY